MIFFASFSRLSFALIFLIAAFFFAGCTKEKVVIKLNGDGSGKLLVYKILTFETSLLIEQQMKSSRQNFDIKKASESDKDSFGDAELSEVKYVDEYGQKGWVAVYSFKDINNISIPANVTFMNPMPDVTDQKRNFELLTFKFDKASKTLNVIYPDVQNMPESLMDLPPVAQNGIDRSAAVFLNLTGKETPDDYYRKLFWDMSYEVIIEKPDTKENTVKLIDFDMNKLSEKDTTAIKYIFTNFEQNRQRIIQDGFPISPLESKYPEIFNRQNNARLEIK